MSNLILVCVFALFISPVLKAESFITCDSIDRLGTQGKVQMDLTEKTILLAEEGKNSVVFDQHTFCGFRPSSDNIECPFTAQENDSILTSDLRCFLQTENTSTLFINGQFSINKKTRSGSLKCSVRSSRGFDLKLSSCH